MTQNLMKSYNFVDPHFDRGHLSYFEQRNDTQDEAEKFCRSLGENWMIIPAHIYQRFNRNKIHVAPLGRYILSQLGVQQEKLFWTDRISPDTGTATLARFRRSSFSASDFQLAALPASVGTMCWNPVTQ
jgi:hypothetical protein